ncbi:MAG: prolipoprotein diacylglyceryl transferase [Thermodesulfobacteriota bacterium]
MYPELFKIGTFSVSSFGLMVALAFLAAYWISQKECQRKGISIDLHGNFFLAAMIGGIAGAKLLYIFENIGFSDFVSNPVQHIFARGGLTFYGGLIGATLLSYIVIKREGGSFLKVGDAIAPSLALAYSIGRIGCLLVGDDYGIPSDLPWALSFPDGLPPTNVAVHPTQIYETIIMFIVFVFLWKIRKKNETYGWLFSIYLILAGLERFFIEFIRNTTDSPIPGLSVAQITALLLIVIGIFKFLSINSKTNTINPN